MKLTPRLWLVVFAVLQPATAPAQVNDQPIQTEVRADGIFARTSGVEVGIGLTVPTGIYVRSGVVAGIGAGHHGVEGRSDLVSRFSLDPFRQSNWAPYGGAGISGRYRTAADGGSRAYLMIFLGVEGPLASGKTGGWIPAVEAGLGGGARLGVSVRQGITGRR